MLAFSCSNGLVRDGETVGFDPRDTSGKLKVYKAHYMTKAMLDSYDIPPGGLVLNSPDAQGGPFNNHNEVVAIIFNGQMVLVDWTAVYARWLGQPTLKPQTTKDYSQII